MRRHDGVALLLDANESVTRGQLPARRPRGGLAQLLRRPGHLGAPPVRRELVEVDIGARAVVEIDVEDLAVQVPSSGKG